MATITQYIAGLGYGGRRYGSFAGKSQAAPARTMYWAGLGYGGMRYNLSYFAGKTSTDTTASDYIIRWGRRRGRR